MRALARSLHIDSVLPNAASRQAHIIPAQRVSMSVHAAPRPLMLLRRRHHDIGQARTASLLT